MQTHVFDVEVTFLVSVSCSNVSKTFLTVAAFVRFDAKVKPDVSGQVRLLHKFFGAVRATVSGTKVNQLVFGEHFPSLQCKPKQGSLLWLLLQCLFSFGQENFLRQHKYVWLILSTLI